MIPTTRTLLALLLLLLTAIGSAQAAGPRTLEIQYDRPGVAKPTHVGHGTPKLWEGRYPNGVVYTVWFVEPGAPAHQRARALWSHKRTFPGAIEVGAVQSLGKGTRRIAAAVWRRSSDRWHVLSAVRPLGPGYAMIELSSARENMMTGAQVENAVAVAMDMRILR